MIHTFAGFNMGLSAPAVPVLSYTAESTFTITNYDATLTYVVVGASPSGNQLTSVTNNATITAAYSAGAPVSAARTMLVAAYARILTSVVSTPTDTGCGPRNNINCPDGTIQSTAGNQSGGAPGSLAPDNFCDGKPGYPCDGNCYQLTVTCWNWRWNNYSTGPEGTGYTLIGNVWGKAV